MGRTLILSAARTHRAISRVAYEVVERNQGARNLEIIGIRRRGGALAETLARQIGAIEGRTFNVGRLDIERFRDDRDLAAPQEDQSVVGIDVAERDVILVDDVLFTGRTARAALDAVVHYGRPRTIQLAVLIDRGHREYPIQPNYTGRFIQTKHRERVVVAVDEGFSVYVEE